MTFAEHLQDHRDGDGNYDLDATEDARAKELAAELASPEAIESLTRKAAKQERAGWESANNARSRKQYFQPALSPDLELEVLVLLGDSTAVAYGDMNRQRIQTRKDLRTKSHLDEIRAYDIEMTHWMQTEVLLDDGETIHEAIDRADDGMSARRP
jgi:hypothetical protein